MVQHMHAFPATASVRALPVLMYHSISTITGPMRSLGVPPARLREHVEALDDAGYRLSGLSDALDHVGTGEKVAALTFDDAYADFLDAVPILTDCRASATLYVPVANVAGKADWVRRSPGELGAILGWKQIHEVAGAGIEIGNHGLVHTPLDVLGPREASRQIRASHDRLVQEMQGPIRSFCYPHGYHSSYVRAAVEFGGHDNACEVGRRLCRPHDDRFAIPRIMVTPDLTGAALVELLAGNHREYRARLLRYAQPGWRWTRKFVYRAFGRNWT